MNRYYWPFSPFYPTGRAEALKVARHHARHEHKCDNTPEFQRTVDRYMRAMERTANALVQLAATNDPEAIRKKTCSMFRRKDYNLTAVLFTSYHMRRKEKRDIPKALTEGQASKWAHACRRLSRQHEAFQPVKLKQPTGKVRHTWKFGLIRCSQQLLASWQLLAQRNLPSYDFFPPSDNCWVKDRGGIHGAAARIGAALEQDFRYWALADIRNAYSSISRSVVRNLYAMHDSVLRYVVCPTLPCQRDDGIHYTDGTTHQIASQPQLPQGSAHAWIILSALIDEALHSLRLESKSLCFVVYADNVAIGAQDEWSALCALKSLEAALAAYPRSKGEAAGKLILHDMTICDGFNKKEYRAQGQYGGIATQGSVDFCGYRIRRDLPDDTIHFTPSGKAWRRFWAKVKDKWDTTNSNYDEFLEFVMDRFDQWSPQFHLWKTAKAARELVAIQAVEIHDEIFPNT